MKINQIPDIYIEQYLQGELPENLRKEIDGLIAENPGLIDRINKIKKSDEDILSDYPAELIAQKIIEKAHSRKAAASYSNETRREISIVKTSAGIIAELGASLNNIIKKISSLSGRRYALSIASAAAMILIVIFIFPGIKNINDINTTADNDIRIKGLESKLLLFRMKGKEVEELKNLDTAGTGDIIQVGYIAAGNYRYGVILSIDGRGTVTLHLPDGNSSGNSLVQNKQVLLNKSYELDDSPSFERFIMILSADPIDAGEVIKKAKKLANSRENSLNGSVEAGKNSIEFSITIKKTE